MSTVESEEHMQATLLLCVRTALFTSVIELISQAQTPVEWYRYSLWCKVLIVEKYYRS